MDNIYQSQWGVANPEQANRHRLLKMEIRVKFKCVTNNADMGKHVNFDIRQLRGGKQKLKIDTDDPERNRIVEPTKLQTQQSTSSKKNNILWKQLQQTLRNKKKRESHPRENAHAANREKLDEITKEKELIVSKT